MTNTDKYNDQSPFSFTPNDGAPVQFSIIGERSERTPHLFMCSWYYVANAGVNFIWAKDAETAYRSQYYGEGPVRFIITQVDPDNMPKTYGGEQ